MVASARTYSVIDYLRLEQQSGERYEYYDGKLEHMPGGTISHNRISRNILIELGKALSSKPELEVFSSDQKIFLPKFNFYLYPDAIVVAGGPLQVEKMADAITNPLLIVEVLSKSTENYDRGQKFVEYQSLPSFREYVLLRQDVPEALIFMREQPDVWRSSEVAGLEQEVLFQSIDVRIAMQAIYHKVEFS